MSLKFIFTASGILGCYCLYSLLQEKLFKGTFGEGDKFTFVLTLIFLTTVCNYFHALLIRRSKHVPSEDHTPTQYYCCVALTYLLGMITSFMALQWVSYPTQVIAKSAKPIPVLIMGVLIGNKTFPVRKYFIIFLIVFGVAAFLYREDKAAKSHVGFGIGEVLLFASLLMDGLTNSIEERVMAQYKPKSENLMLGINKWALIFVGLPLLYTGEIVQCILFILQYPLAVVQMGAIAVTGSLGQFFIFMCLTEYGTLTCSVITTLRKFFTVLGSVILFGHTLKLRQWFAVVCVFSGLFLDVYFGKARKTVEK